MKHYPVKYILIILCILNQKLPDLNAEKNFIRSLNIQTGISDSFSDSKKEHQLTWDSGFKLTSLPFTLTAFYGKEDFRWGIESRINQKYLFFDTKILAGFLKHSGAVSRLKSPLPASFSPLKSPLLPSQGITSSLPGLNGSCREFSTAIYFSPGTLSRHFPSIQAAFIPHKEFFFNLNKNLPFFFKGNLTAGITGGLFRHGYKATSQWFLKRLPYKEDYYGAGEILLNINLPAIKSSAAFSIFQNPFGTPAKALTLTDSLILENFTLNALLYFADEDLISASSSQSLTKMELKINPQYLFTIKNAQLNTGLSLEKTYSPSPSSSIKAALQLTAEKRKASLTFSRSRQKKKASYSSRLLLTVPVLKIKNSISFLYKYSDSKENISFSHSISAPGCPLTTAGMSFASDIRPAENQRIKIWMQFNLAFKRIKVNGKVSFSFSGDFL
ncbi:hypothetical protein [Treponema sp.]|uniref:hypothetical protein n=1 Tax=Treponema sp. TaxID=166 RepID=UPI0025ECCFBA|nr:hypothetical protein [Treponema sp.]MCR5217641.1 hypothetical protein [Treponema sp.]